MKGSGKIILLIALACFLTVYYVRGQIDLVRVSYILDQKVKLKTEKEEHYRQLKYEMEQMRSPRLLESKLSELKFDLTLPAEIKVIRMTQPSPWLVQSQGIAERVGQNPFAEKLTNFFERWVKVAQAKTEA